MSRIFLSHSSKDDSAAIAVSEWLQENGWDDVFLDLDPDQGIHPGERWERTLYEHAARCAAVIFLVSQNWIGSEWCRREFELARKLNKRIFVAIIDATPMDKLPPYLTETLQAVSLEAGEDHQVRRITLPRTHEEKHVTFSTEGLQRLKAGLTQAGLDPRFFAWPPPDEPNRAPYRGLEPFEAVDAGIFFGRDAPVIEALDALRGLREAAAPRLFVILGASGAGKSSFLRAGLLPRLVRDDRAFLPLAPIRPERAAMTGANGLVAALAAACAEQGMKVTRAALREAAAQGADALRPHLKQLVARAAETTSVKAPPTLVISVDQAEELFRAEGAVEGEALINLLRDLARTDDPAVIVLFVIRSDSYDTLEHAKALEGMSQRTFPLLPMPRGVYQTVIEGPAQRFTRAGRKFDIDPALTQALLDDLDRGGGSDALPLLAFTLSQLFGDHEAAGRLTRADYEKFGGLKGAIDAAVARLFVAADADPRIPRDNEARLALLRRALIPWLAGIDPETRSPRRRRASEAQIPAEARPLTDLLVEHRLLTRAVDDVTHETTVEPAHEALLRQWGSLKGWLEEDFGRLVTLEGVKRAARDWDANARDPAWATHGGARLEDAARLDTRPDLAALLDATDRAYLVACREKQNLVLAQERKLADAELRAARRTRIGLAASIVLGLIAAGAAVYGFQQARIAQQRSAVLGASVSQSFAQEGALDQALLLALEGAQAFDDASAPDKIRIAFSAALRKRERVETRTLFPNMQVFETPEALLLTNPANGDIWKLTDSAEPRRFLAGTADDSKIAKLKVSQSGKEYIVLRENGDVERIDAASAARRKVGTFAKPPKRAGRDYDLNQDAITDDGLIVRSFNIPEGADKEKFVDGKYLFQAFDTENSRTLQAEVTFDSVLAGRRAGGGVYVFDMAESQDEKDKDKQLVWELVPSGNSVRVQKVKLANSTVLALQYGSCVARMPKAASTTVVEEVNGLNSAVNCRKFSSDYLVDVTMPTSGGPDRTDLLIKADGKKVQLRDALSKAATDTISANNFAWVSTQAVPQEDKTSKQIVAILLNRNLYVLSKTDDADDWTLDHSFRHPAFVGSGRFIGPDRVVVVEAESGRLFVHDFAARPAHRLLTSSMDNLIDAETPIEPANVGTCVGYSIPRIDKATLPDGRTVDMTDAGLNADKYELRVSGPKETVIALDPKLACLQFSADWKKMLVVGETMVTIYDFDKVLASGSLAGNETSTLQVKLVSAFFVGTGATRIVGADYSNSVKMWSENAQAKTWSMTEIYRGDNGVFYAEPDATGQRLIVMESTGGGSVRGFLYSVQAREIWSELGTEYKWLGAAFAGPSGSEIPVSEHNTWMRVVPILPLSRLVALAEQSLAPECVPANPKDYRNSRCWPPGQ